MERVSLIIVNWNTGGLLRACLEGIASLPEQALIGHVVVIDNASKDDSVREAQEVALKHKYTIIQEKYNLGFAKANNLAWKYIEAHGGEHDHILLLNPDTEMHFGSLEAMVT